MSNSGEKWLVVMNNGDYCGPNAINHPIHHLGVNLDYPK